MPDDPRPQALPSIAPRELATALEREPGACLVVDVREPFELALAALPDVLHIPMRQLPMRVSEVPRDRSIVLMCHHGVRSAWATRLLREHGFDAVNLSGGIARYARDVDPGVGTY